MFDDVISFIVFLSKFGIIKIIKFAEYNYD
nr:MAG TPA: hypothetical protein [Caudoviricetes sp.]